MDMTPRRHQFYNFLRCSDTLSLFDLKPVVKPSSKLTTIAIVQLPQRPATAISMPPDLISGRNFPWRRAPAPPRAIPGVWPVSAACLRRLAPRSVQSVLGARANQRAGFGCLERGSQLRRGEALVGQFRLLLALFWSRSPIRARARGTSEASGRARRLLGVALLLCEFSYSSADCVCHSSSALHLHVPLRRSAPLRSQGRGEGARLVQQKQQQERIERKEDKKLQ